MTASDRRFIRQTGREARIAAIVEPVAQGLGYDLVRVKMTQENGLTLQIMAEDRNGRFSIADCERLSKDVSPVLDVEDPIEREYNLEVSSPGIDRPLVRARDFIRWQGHEARIEMADLLDGRKRFRGLIAAADETHVTIRLPDATPDGRTDFVLPLEDVAEAKLMMTDALLEAARLAQEAEPDPDLDDPDIEQIEDDLDRDDSDAAAHQGEP